MGKLDWKNEDLILGRSYMFGRDAVKYYPYIWRAVDKKPGVAGGPNIITLILDNVKVDRGTYNHALYLGNDDVYYDQANFMAGFTEIEKLAIIPMDGQLIKIPSITNLGYHIVPNDKKDDLNNNEIRICNIPFREYLYDRPFDYFNVEFHKVIERRRSLGKYYWTTSKSNDHVNRDSALLLKTDMLPIKALKHIMIFAYVFRFVKTCSIR